MRSLPLPAQDQKLVQIVNAALADSTRRSGSWLVCKTGCTQCCVGVFAISQLDAARLQQGLDELERVDPERAAAVRERSRSAVARLSPAFPGNALTGILAEDEDSVMVFEDFANEEPCPVLDPATGRCELYASRPITCRSFGPPVRSEDGLGVCELCYHGATDEQIADCEMSVDPDDLEEGLLLELEKVGGPAGATIIAFALAD
jgi:Fe-S-cluster containining protein